MNTRFKHFKTMNRIAIGAMFFGLFFLNSCSTGVLTPEDTKYLEEFHRANFEPQEKPLREGDLNLFVDYSTCNTPKLHSDFFKDITAHFSRYASAYYSIKGSEIQKEEKDFYVLFKEIEESNNAELANAAQMMADGDCESVLITDGEYYPDDKSKAKDHDRDPYLADAFRTWILKGYDIHIISEPYVELNNGKSYNKKRFYIMFTDDRMQNNIYERIRRNVDFTKFPEVDEFHISASHPQMNGNGNNCSIQSEILESKSKGYGTFEIEDWSCSWKTIESAIVNAIDEETGKPLKIGVPIIQLGLDKNSFGCYRIKSVDLKVYDINVEYNAYYESKINGGKPGHQDYSLNEIENFMQIDSKEFEKHSKINISFNQEWFEPNVLTGKPYNYVKLDLAIGDVQSIFRQHEEKFEFESITQPGSKNVSVSSSIKQCLADDKVLEKIRGQVIYSIYVKSGKTE